MIEYVTDDNKLLALIIRNSFQEEGIHFCTPPDFSQQLAYMNHPAGKTIQAHIHNPVHRNVVTTQEVLFIKKGKLRVDFYSQNQHYVESRIITAGDVLLLAQGGHGFEVLESVEMFEVKQGPYAGDGDKTRFEGVGSSDIVFKEQ